MILDSLVYISEPYLTKTDTSYYNLLFGETLADFLIYNIQLYYEYKGRLCSFNWEGTPLC